MRYAVLFLLTVCALAEASPAQLDTSECGSSVVTAAGGEDQFIRCARQGTFMYLDRAAAILDGYRLIGSDFPSMGEHWINLALLFDDKFTPQEPEILSYVVISGKPRLVGVAYALPLLPGETPPEWPANGAWHEHYRTLNDETVSPEHHLPGLRRDRARMAMLHAWIWTENPDGTFAADNWTIPYLRLDLVPPSGAPSDAAQALSLVSGGAAHFLARIQRPEGMSSAERRRIESAFDLAKAEVEHVIEARSSSILTAPVVAQLSEIWAHLSNAVEGLP